MAKTPEEIRMILKQELANIAPEADLDALSPFDDVREELDIDSFDFVRYIAAMCDTLGVDVPEVDYMAFTTLAGAERYLARSD